jgi:hypothetical protein
MSSGFFLPIPTASESPLIQVGSYDKQNPVSVTDTVGGIEIIPASSEPVRFLMIRLTGSPVYIAPGTPTATDFAFQLTPEMQLLNAPFGGQQWKAICSTGKTATVQIWIAPAV